MPLMFRAANRRHLRAALMGACTLVVAGGAFAQDKPERKTPAKPSTPATQPAQTQPAPTQVQQQSGQPQQPTGPVRIELSPSQADWTKVCGHDNVTDRDICYTTRDFGAQTDKPPTLAMAVYDVKGDEQRLVKFLLPVGLALRPGIRFSVDKGATIDGSYETCFPNGCFADVKIKGPTIDAMKKGQVVNIAVQDATTVVTLIVPVAGFGKAFDGPAVDPKVLEEQQKKLQEDMQKKAEDMRRSEATKSGGAIPSLTPMPQGTQMAPATK